MDEPLADADAGPLLEGLVLHELRAAIAYQGLGGEIFYWSTPGSKEIDFIWIKGSRRVAVEVKNSRKWRAGYAKTINEFLDDGRATRGFVVYRGKERYRSGKVDGLPVEDCALVIVVSDRRRGRRVCQPGQESRSAGSQRRGGCNRARSRR